jgi:hypothetical protein
VEIEVTKSNRLIASLDVIRRSPLARISSDQKDDVVHRIVDREADSLSVDVAAFNSAI